MAGAPILTLGLAALALATATTASASPTLSNGPSSKLVGQWHGRSLCVTSRPACTDETVVYVIRKDAQPAEHFHIAADKIVDGKRLPMGVLDCRFEALRQQLVCPMGAGQWQFRWDGDMLDGGLIEPDGAFRFVHLVRG